MAYKRVVCEDDMLDPYSGTFSMERTFEDDIENMFATIREVSDGIESGKIQRDIRSQPTRSGRMKKIDEYIELSDRMRGLGQKVLSMSVDVSDIVEL